MAATAMTVAGPAGGGGGAMLRFSQSPPNILEGVRDCQGPLT